MTEIISASEYRRRTPEHKLQVLALDVLYFQKAHPDIFAFAIPNAARRSPRLAASMKAEGLMAGVADLCVMLPCNRVAWLELKKFKGRQSVEQKAFEARCKRLGHPYAVCSSLEQICDFLKQIGALK